MSFLRGFLCIFFIQRMSEKKMDFYIQYASVLHTWMCTQSMDHSHFLLPIDTVYKQYEKYTYQAYICKSLYTVAPL